jgi:hypothetical protein
VRRQRGEKMVCGVVKKTEKPPIYKNPKNSSLSLSGDIIEISINLCGKISGENSSHPT